MAIKKMVQWAPGTKPQRMDRNDGVYKSEMEALREKLEKQTLERRTPKMVLFTKDEVVLNHLNEVVRVDDVDPNGYWLLHRNAKIGVECFKKLPVWFQNAYSDVLKEIAGGT